MSASATVAATALALLALSALLAAAPVGVAAQIDPQTNSSTNPNSTAYLYVSGPGGGGSNTGNCTAALCETIDYAIDQANTAFVDVTVFIMLSENGGTPHSINLSLLPLSQTEQEFIDHRLGRGAVDILSRGYGKCQVISTLAPNVWWVRYFNSMGTPILNSLEVVDVPLVVKAAPEDLRDSATRLDDILEPYWSEIGSCE